MFHEYYCELYAELYDDLISLLWENINDSNDAFEQLIGALEEACSKIDKAAALAALSQSYNASNVASIRSAMISLTNEVRSWEQHSNSFFAEESRKELLWGLYSILKNVSLYITCTDSRVTKYLRTRFVSDYLEDAFIHIVKSILIIQKPQVDVGKHGINHIVQCSHRSAYVTACCMTYLSCTTKRAHSKRALYNNIEYPVIELSYIRSTIYAAQLISSNTPLEYRNIAGTIAKLKFSHSEVMLKKCMKALSTWSTAQHCGNVPIIAASLFLSSMEEYMEDTTKSSSCVIHANASFLLRFFLLDAMFRSRLMILIYQQKEPVRVSFLSTCTVNVRLKNIEERFLSSLKGLHKFRNSAMVATVTREILTHIHEICTEIRHLASIATSMPEQKFAQLLESVLVCSIRAAYLLHPGEVLRNLAHGNDLFPTEYTENCTSKESALNSLKIVLKELKARCKRYSAADCNGGYISMYSQDPYSCKIERTSTQPTECVKHKKKPSTILLVGTVNRAYHTAISKAC
ncbi:hypothetical protein [Anaplasma bovis]|uniref:hypothetical protein n=1 Tax=Anaplasma bovis TaxID=186733 RepID=UPI002FF0741E